MITNIDETIDRWMRQADHDLENAKKNLDIEAYDEEPPRTHSLRKLIELTDMPDEALKLVAKLDSYYLVLRYPDVGDVVPYENVDKEDAEDGIDKAEQIVELARTQIYKEGIDGT